MVHCSAFKYTPCLVRCFIKFEVLPPLRDIALRHLLHVAESDSALHVKCSQTLERFAFDIFINPLAISSTSVPSSGTDITQVDVGTPGGGKKKSGTEIRHQNFRSYQAVLRRSVSFPVSQGT